MSDRSGIFAGDDPFAIAQSWLKEAEASEINDPNAIALSTVDASGLPNARMVLLKGIEPDAFVFYTNYESAKAGELDSAWALVEDDQELADRWAGLHEVVEVAETDPEQDPSLRAEASTLRQAIELTMDDLRAEGLWKG